MRRLLTVAATTLLLLTGCAQTPVVGPVTGPATAAAPIPASDAAPRPTATASEAPTPSAFPTRSETPPAGATGPAVPTTPATLPPAGSGLAAPARFLSPPIGVDLPVVAVGVADDGQMELPGSVREVGWYSYGPRPGEPAGTTVLAAHVDTRADGLGPFARLRDLRRGDALIVTDARGRDRHYVVRAVDDVEKADLAMDQLFRRDGEPELKVVTCGGPFSKRTGYRDNLVVSARPR